MSLKNLELEGWSINKEDLNTLSFKQNSQLIEKAIQSLDASLLTNHQLKNISEEAIKENNKILMELSRQFQEILMRLSNRKEEKAKSWKFKIARDKNALISEITAKAD